MGGGIGVALGKKGRQMLVRNWGCEVMVRRCDAGEERVKMLVRNGRLWGLGFTAKQGIVRLRDFGFKAACVPPAWE